MYTLREFRAKTKEAFDKAHVGPVEIIRNGVSYTLRVSGGREVVTNPIGTVLTIKNITKVVPKELSFKPCKHGADPKFCKFSKPGSPCK